MLVFIHRTFKIKIENKIESICLIFLLIFFSVLIFL